MKKVFITKTPSADTRSATGLMSVEEVTRDTNQHIKDVKSIIYSLAEEMMLKASNHDHTKLENIEEFTEALNKGFIGEQKIKDSLWWTKHLVERHHLNDSVPADVTLLDVIEMIADGVAAGKARTGDVYDIELPSDILQEALINTQHYIMENAEIVGNDSDECCESSGLESVKSVFERYRAINEVKYDNPDAFDVYYQDPDTREIIKGPNILPHEPDYFLIDHLIYIGNKKTYDKFSGELGIDEFYSYTYSRSRVAIVGKNSKTGEWFGWSHRGYGKFYPGYVVKEGSMLSKKFVAGYSPQTDEQLRLVAEVFADLMD